VTKPRLFITMVCLFVLAAIAFAGSPWIAWPLTRNQRLTDMAVAVSALMGPIWMLLALISVCSYGKRALWAFLGLPFALASDAWFVLVILACSMGHGCL
jgi:hypothetical protein